MNPHGAPPKRIGMNLLWLVPGVVGGSEEYTTRLLTALADREPQDLHFTLFVNGRFPAAHPALCDRFHTVVAPISGAHKAVRVAAENSWLATATRDHRIELVHYLGGILPAVRPVPSILTVHDLQPLTMPQHFPPAKRWFAKVSIPSSVRSARQVVTLTEFTRRQMHELLGVDLARVVVVPPGFDEPARATDGADIGEIRRRYGIGDARIVLFPAITYPHKNHLTLVRAMARLVVDRPDVVLVLPGGEAQCESVVLAAVSALGLRDRVRRVGRIPAADLDALFRAASVVAFPSISEGFGLPVLEAMSRGCPVVAADATALPEVIDGAGVLVPPRDPDAWAAALAGVLDDPRRREELVRAGRAWSASFRWESSAAALENLYRTGPPL